ncbi:MAG TPA: FadR/GntR family transcriptional regulator [Polyangiaceae bacterium]|jgi:GntR family transcriptional repressor for pyruvate dehydrogenase complex|nr:FadR/GntR family transcriptional regulator [Polyangiaceae bacterium]
MRTAGKDGGHYKAGSTAEIVLEQIRRMIESGELKPGDRLPAERDLAKRFKMSRASLRAALHSVAGMGLLQFRHGSGTYIKDGPPVLNDGPLSLLASLHGFTDDEMFEARRHLEVGVAGLAAERATAADLDKMHEEIAGMASALHNPQQYLVHDMSFHRMVASASSNPILAALVELTATILYQHRRQTVAGARDFAPSLAMHRRIYRAIASGDPARAREAMNRHLDQTQRARRRELAAATVKRKKPTRTGNGAHRKLRRA